jgi:GntR family transcriptional repressor for pyruvate dehydrogenase complex
MAQGVARVLRMSYEIITHALEDGVAGRSADAEQGSARAPRARAFQSIVEQVRGDIFRHRLEPGDRLPPEPLLSEQFGVSRTGVREALRVLELQGLVRVRHGYEGGVFVAEPGASPILSALETSFQLGQVDVDELYQARVLFEPTMARLAVERGAERLATELADNVARAEGVLAAAAPAFAANLEFHAIIARAAGNRVLSLVMHAFLELLESVDRDYPTNPEISRQALAEHQVLLDAVRARDGGQVERLMQAHLVRLEDRFAAIQARVQRERSAAREALAPA